MKFNRILASILAVTIIGTSMPMDLVDFPKIPMTANAEETDVFKYKTLADGTIEITKCLHTVTQAEIPAEINGVKVTRIGHSAFSGCSVLTSVTIPDTVTSIGDMAFHACSVMTSVNIPDSVISIGDFAFERCLKLTSIDIPDSVVSIGNYAFIGCSGFTSVTIPNSVTNIGNAAFKDCSELTEIIIPESVTYFGANAFLGTPWLEEKQKDDPLVIVNGIIIDGTACSGDVVIPDYVTNIGNFAFSECTGLTSITIPDSVTCISDGAFHMCSELTEITIPESVTEIGRIAFLDTAWLKKQQKRNPLVIVNNILIDGEKCSGNVVIPDNVTSICEYAFAGCMEMMSITIPDSVTSIGIYAFAGCSALMTITIPDSITSIGNSTFAGCSALTSITIPDSVTEIGEHAFYECSGLTSISIPDSVTSIDFYAFADCSKLTYITLPDSVTSISECMFVGCDSLTAITIPSSVKSIGGGAFADCSSLTSITILNPDCEIYDHSYTISNGRDYAEIVIYFNGTIYGYENSTVQAYAEKYDKKFKLTSESPESYLKYKTLDSGTLEITGCDKTITKAEIPDEIDGIKVTSIGESAFAGCSELTEITIPESVVSIGEGAFADCAELTSITVLNPNCKIYDTADTITSDTIYGYENSTAQTYAEKYDKKFESLGKVSPESYLEYKTLDDGTIEITRCDPAITFKAEIPDEIDGKKVTSIGNKTFSWCLDMPSVTIPDSVTNIGNSAFSVCRGLTEINIPDSVTSIGSYAFFDCSGLTEVTIPESVTNIGNSAFKNCSELTSVTIPENLTNIGYWAFSSTPWLENKQKDDPLVIVNGILIDGTTCSGDVIIPDNVERIGDQAFMNCTDLTSVTIPDSVTSIGDLAFSCCSGLTEITIPESVASIGYSAFSNCSELTSITILDPDCEIYNDDKTISNFYDVNNYYYFTGTIYGYENSTAQTYAERYRRKFVSLGEAPASEVIAGDANCDGKVSIADATAILQHLGNQDKYGLSAEGLKNADVDGNDGVSTNDALVIQKVDANLLTVEQLPLKN